MTAITRESLDELKQKVQHKFALNLMAAQGTLFVYKNRARWEGARLGIVESSIFLGADPGYVDIYDDIIEFGDDVVIRAVGYDKVGDFFYVWREW